MSTLANAHPLFSGLRRTASFNKEVHIQTGDPEDKLLRNARRTLRQAIRERLNNLGTLLTEGEGNKIRITNTDSMSAAAKGRNIRALDVRFLSQGSFVYETLVRPAQPEHQEIDLDDGIYIPIEFEGGYPVLPSAALFYAVESALGPVVKENGWTFERKSTCVRVTLTGEGAHIDLPLFAVNQEDFNRVEENFRGRVGLLESREAATLNDSQIKDRESFRVGKDLILLAHREKNWEQSDPKAFQDWFEDCAARFGPVLRRMCRYLKAWRDEHFAESHLSSLALMVVCVEACEKLDGEPVDNRDDLLMWAAAETLTSMLKSGMIPNPIVEDAPPLDAKVTAEERAKLVSAAETLDEQMDQALNATHHAQIVVNRLRAAYGTRLPDEPDAVAVRVSDQTAAHIVRESKTVPMPRVGSSVSG
tara:strand:- start:3958 stop:5214 length:1257 start_codon:yes stop_codon:yes gene_type:complete